MLVAELMTVRCHISQGTCVLCGSQDEETQLELMAREQHEETRYQKRQCFLNYFLLPVSPSAIFVKQDQKCTGAILEEFSAAIYLKNKARPL